MPSTEEFIQKAQAAVDSLKKELGTIRTGRATTSLVDGILIESYGILTPLNQLASIKVTDATTIVIEPWDNSILHAIEKAITDSQLGVNPAVDGNLIRINLPQLTEEKRKELCKVVNQHCESSRATLRSLRNKSKDKIKEEAASEDDVFALEKGLQEKVEQFNALVDEMKDKKTAEIMSI